MYTEYNYTYMSTILILNIITYMSINFYKSTFLYFMLYKWKQKQINYIPQHHY